MSSSTASAPWECAAGSWARRQPRSLRQELVQVVGVGVELGEGDIEVLGAGDDVTRAVGELIRHLGQVVEELIRVSGVGGVDVGQLLEVDDLAVDAVAQARATLGEGVEDHSELLR